MIGTLVSLAILIVIVAHLIHQNRQHQQRLNQIPIRIHVNGIRGKSTVTRLIAAVLREAGYTTVGKTTGSAARVIQPDGTEVEITRYGAPTITEQMRIIRENTAAQTEALVIECMAVNPQYQKITQEQIVRGNICVITNVREDHQDLMGETLEEIADSLSNTIPDNGLLITAETRPKLAARLERSARARGSDFIAADANWVTDDDLRGFNYLSFKENLAIGLAVAQLLGIPRETAMRGMSKALPDIGAVFIRRAQVRGKEIVWAPLFAVNDRESSIIGIDALRPYYRPGATRIGVLNNRYDRAVRAMQFADIAARDLEMDYYITCGAYERQVTDRMVELGFPRERILNLGDSRQPTLDEMLEAIAGLVQGQQGVVVGLVNIHTPQAEMLIQYFEGLIVDEDQRILSTYLEHMSGGARSRYLPALLAKAQPKGQRV